VYLTGRIKNMALRWNAERLTSASFVTRLASVRGRVVVLDASNNDIDHLPPLRFPDLEKLFLQGNRISSLPEDFFANMPNLRVLNLSANNLERLSASVDLLGSLERLILNDNRLSTLPFEITSLESLEYLGLERNLLPAHIAKYSNGKMAVNAHLQQIALLHTRKFHDIPLIHVKS
jgi:Leucine-rich repeat (LRR) protein